MSPRSTPGHTPSLLSWIVFVGGMIGAYAAGVATYREVGLYGGPVASGFFREWDPAKQQYQLYHVQKQPSGERIKRLFADNLTVQRTDVPVGAGTVAIEAKPDSLLGFERIGFSLGNDGVIDSWVTRDPKSGLTRVEISTRRNGRIDRWEYYQRQVMVRVELDTNGNGKPDRTQRYQDGIQVETIVDANEDGEPDEGREK